MVSNPHGFNVLDQSGNNGLALPRLQCSWVNQVTKVPTMSSNQSGNNCLDSPR